MNERDTRECGVAVGERSPMYKASSHRGAAYHSSITSKEAYADACIELFSRLWVELDAVFATDDPMRSAGFIPAPRVETLRLELILLLDACRSTRWRAQLDSSQRHFLLSILNHILDALNASREGVLRGPIESAQTRLLDAIQEQCAALSATSRSSWCVAL
jgi:hypothetical protein